MSFPRDSKISPNLKLGPMKASSSSTELYVSICEFNDWEEKIRNPDDEQVFLTASMAFLRKMIAKRIEEKQVNKNCCNSSDILLITNNRNEFELVQLKNVEVNKEVFENEARKAKKALPFDAILPQPIRRTCNSKLVNFINSSFSRISLTNSNSLLRLLFKKKKCSTNTKAKNDVSISSLDDTNLSTEISAVRLEKLPSE